MPDSAIHKLGTRQPAIRLFLSSTFTDTELERNVLIEDVYPFLKALGQRMRVQVYQSSEMRWGIRSEASSSHQTSEICMQEIARCQEESTGVSYVLILGNKYGFRPFPAKLPETEFTLLHDEIKRRAEDSGAAKSDEQARSTNTKALKYLEEWYVLDNNAVPPTRVLRPVGKDESDAWWSDIFPTLQTTLRAAALAVLPADQQPRFWQSVTAEEVQNGILSLPSQEERDKGCFVVDRTFDGFDAASDPKKAKLFVDMAGDAVDEDAQTLLEKERQEAVYGVLSPTRITKASIPWGPGIDLSNKAHAAYMREFADTFCSALADDVERVAREHTYEADPLVEEVAAQALFGNVRREGFVSTSTASTITAAVTAHVQARQAGSAPAAPFAICGASGSGKTSLMAHIAGMGCVVSVCVSVGVGKGNFAFCVALMFPGPFLHAHSHSHTQSHTHTLTHSHTHTHTHSHTLTHLHPHTHTHSVSLPPSLALPPLSPSILAGELSKAMPAEAIVISRFLGTSRDSGSSRRLMGSVIQQLHRVIKNSKDITVPADIDRVTLHFKRALAMGTAAAPVVLVLDSLDQLSDEDQGRKLSWLPLAELPEHCYVVLSTLPDVGGCWDVIKGNVPADNCATVASMTADDADSVLTSWLQLAKRTVTPAQRAALLGAHAACPTPLFLRICVDYFALAWRHTDEIPPDFFPTTVADLLDNVFDNIEKVHGKETVRASLGYLSASRSGLSDNEMEDLLSCNDMVLDEIYEWWEPPVRRVPPLIWVRILSDLKGAVVQRGAEGGVSVRAWYHRQYREAAERRYLDIDTRVPLAQGNVCTSALASQRHSEMADYFAGRWENGRAVHDREGEGPLCDRKVASMNTVLGGCLGDPASGLVVNTRKVALLPYHQMRCQRWEACAETLCDLGFIEAKCFAGLVAELAADLVDFAAHAPADVCKRYNVELWRNFVGSNTHVFTKTPGAVCSRASLYPDSTAISQAADAAYNRDDNRRAVVRRYNKPSQLDPRVASLNGLSRSVTAVTFSRDGHWVAAGSETAELRVWEARTGTAVAKFKLPDKKIASKVVQLPNGLLAVAAQNLVYLYNVDTRDLVQTVEALDKGRYALVLRVTEDDAFVLIASASDSGSTVRFFLPDMSRCVWECRMASPRLANAFYRDGVLVTRTSEGEIVWFDVKGLPASCDEAAALEEPVAGELAQRTSYMPELKGKYRLGRALMDLLPGGHDVICILGTTLYKIRSDGTLLGEGELPTSPYGLSTMKNGELAAVALFDESMALFELKTCKYLTAMKPTMTNAQAVSPDGLMIASGGTNFSYVSVFSVAEIDTDPSAKRDKEALQFYVQPSISMLKRAGDGEERVVFSVAGSTDRVELIDAQTMELCKSVDVSKYTNQVFAAGVSPDSRFLVTRSRGKSDTLVFDLETGQVHEDEFLHGGTDNTPRHFVFSPNSDCCIVANEYGSMMVFALPAAKIIFAHDDKGTFAYGSASGGHHTHEVTGVVWHPNYPDVRQFVTAGADQTARLWELSGDASCDPTQQGFTACTSLRCFEGHSDDVTSVALCVPRGTEGDSSKLVLATASEDDGVWLWRLGDEQPYARCAHQEDFKTHNVSNPMKLLWLPKQQVLLSCAVNQRLKVWNLDGELVRSLPMRTNFLLLHPSLDYVVTLAFGGVELLDANTLEPAFQSYGHDASQGGGSARLSPDGRFLVTRMGDKLILTHDLSHLI